MAAYVIKQWKHSTAPLDGRDTYIHIIGRAPGLLSWFLSLIGIDPTVALRLTGDKLIFESGSLEGTMHRVIPLRNVCSTLYGYRKPLREALAIGILLAVPTFGLGILLAFIYYFLNKRLSIFIVETSGVVSGFEFKRSVIEGQEINEQAAAFVVSQIQAFVDRASGAPQLPAARVA